MKCDRTNRGLPHPSPRGCARSARYLLRWSSTDLPFRDSSPSLRSRECYGQRTVRQPHWPAEPSIGSELGSAQLNSASSPASGRSGLRSTTLLYPRTLLPPGKHHVCGTLPAVLTISDGLRPRYLPLELATYCRNSLPEFRWLAALRGAAMLMNYLPQRSRHANGLTEE